MTSCKRRSIKNTKLTSGDELEEEFRHCQSETSTSSSETCQIRTSRASVGGTNALSRVNPLSQKPMDSKRMDVTHLTSTVPATYNRLGQKQSGHLCWSSSKPVTTLNLSRLSTSEAATPRKSIILRTVITKRSFLLKMVWCSKPIDLWFQPHWQQSI